jgi:sensor histidine kinase YesM
VNEVADQEFNYSDCYSYVQKIRLVLWIQVHFNL